MLWYIAILDCLDNTSKLFFEPVENPGGAVNSYVSYARKRYPNYGMAAFGL